ncbi:three-Cys-motif partner protein TcmP [Chitinophaga oryziterrae]|nr:three-Cys-motif partner protein TcmP [Chitinophaga oryziterrae]
MNSFGGSWTIDKMEIVVAYAQAYLTIMNKQAWVKTLYFDGFAGSGHIDNDPPESEDVIKGTALRILEIEDPKSFDLYYFVEKNKKNKNLLEQTIKDQFPNKSTFIVQGDCNQKLESMADYLKKNKQFRALAFIDPYGMSVNWKSIESLKDAGVDLWILVPTGIGVGRLLTQTGKIDDLWLNRLEIFLGMDKEDIRKHFYKRQSSFTLFGEENWIEKEKGAIEKAGILYQEKLKTVFKYVSDSFAMRNSMNVIMYHFMMATNNKAGLKIANDIIKPNYKL